ncbi:YdcF family protein [Dyadobacter tibetensis]|uniref:YdcF family protein n=1 Tax=Dyadobacter tibetensis TaxID=1211851 RepID=UPI00046E736F|nr:YdcF family protein [Dyadobacter tibetensis]
MRYFFIILFLIPFSKTSVAQRNKPLPSYEQIHSGDLLMTKNYYLLTLLDAIRPARSILEKDEVLNEVTKNNFSQLDSAVSHGGRSLASYSNAMFFSEETIQRVGERLEELYGHELTIQKLVRDHLIPSGMYYSYQDNAPQLMLRKAWEQDARAVNHAISVYGMGRKANYPAIDSAYFTPGSATHQTLVADLAYVIHAEGNNQLFTTIPLKFALGFLALNNRFEAIDFEPLEQGVNQAAIKKGRAVHWGSFPYSVVLIPGSGPSDPNLALSPVSMLRCRLGALRYFQKKAPFIVVSGGRVHPFKTKYSEALEMKKYLIDVMQVPEEAIIMDPHARHTTTNIRNTARLIFRYGFPFEKAALITTTEGQSRYIESEIFAKRCQSDLSYLPFRLGKRLSATDIEFYPMKESLHIDDDEPLDP